MTLLDVAQAMRGKLRDGYSAPQAGGAAMTSNLSYGTATVGSSGGFVEIIMDNAPTDDDGFDPDDYTFEVSCDTPISQGDRVALVTIDGTSKAISMETAADDIAGLHSEIVTSVNELADGLGVQISEITSRLDDQGAIVSQVDKNFLFGIDGLTIGQSDSPVKANLDNDGLTFTANGQDVLKLDAETSTADMDRLKMGKYRWQSVDNGDALALVYVG